MVAQTEIIRYYFACILQGICTLSVFQQCFLIAFLLHFLGLRSFASFIAFYHTLVSANNFVSPGYFISYTFSLDFFLILAVNLTFLLFFCSRGYSLHLLN